MQCKKLTLSGDGETVVGTDSWLENPSEKGRPEEYIFRPLKCIDSSYEPSISGNAFGIGRNPMSPAEKRDNRQNEKYIRQWRFNNMCSIYAEKDEPDGDEVEACSWFY